MSVPETSRLPVSVCVLATADAVGLTETVICCARWAGEVLIAAEGLDAAVREDVLAAGARLVDVPESAAGAETRNALAGEARFPWILTLASGEWPDDDTEFWLRGNLDRLVPGAYRGFFQLPGEILPAARLCLYDRGLTFKSGYDDWIVDADGRNVEPQTQPDLAFSCLAMVDMAILAVELGRLRQLLREHPDAHEGRYVLSERLKGLGRYREAYEVLLAAWETPAWHGAWVPGELPAMLAWLTFRFGDHQRTVAFARAALEQEPSQIAAWEVLTKSHFRQSAASAVADARAWVAACNSGTASTQRLLALNPGATAEAYRHLIWALVAQGHRLEAEGIAAQAEVPFDVHIYLALTQGDIEQAIRLVSAHHRDPLRSERAWREQLARHQHVPVLVEGMIWGSLNQALYVDLAINCFDEAIKLDPGSPEPYWRRAVLQVKRKGAWQRARADIYASLQRDPDQPWLWAFLCRIAELHGDPQAAQAARTEADRRLARQQR